MEDDDRWRGSISLKSKCWLVRSEVVLADSGVITDKACDAMLLMPMRKDVKATTVGAYVILSMLTRRDVKTTADEACGMPMGQESMKTSS